MAAGQMPDTPTQTATGIQKTQGVVLRQGLTQTLPGLRAAEIKRYPFGRIIPEHQPEYDEGQEIQYRCDIEVE